MSTDQATAAFPNPAMAMDYAACKKAGGKCTVGQGGMLVCELKGKTYTQKPTKAAAAQKFTSIEITSDGSRDGTTIKVNGTAISALASLSFSFLNDGYNPAVFLSYATQDKEPKPGTLSQRNYFSLVPPEAKSDAAQATRAVASLQEVDEIPPGLAHLPRLLGSRAHLFAQLGV